MNRPICGALLLLASAAVAGCGQAVSDTAQSKNQNQEPLVVYDLPVTQVVTDYEDFPGRTDAIYSVEIRARVSGYLNRVYFQDGVQVSKGAELFLIDPRPFKATLDRSKAALEQAEAHARRLSNEYRRAQVLYERGLSISREEYDRYSFDHAEADAALGTAKANVDLAALDLEFTHVAAPIDGRLSRRMVDPGNLVKADETVLTTVVSQDPLYVYFDVHEAAMLRIRRLLEEHEIKARSEKEVTVLISLSDEKDSEGKDVFRHQGIVDFTDNRVDLQTGTLRFRARLDNPSGLITPGLFVKVRLPIGDAHDALMIREQALQSDQGQKKVFVLEPKDEEGKPYFILDAKGEPVKDKKGDPIPAYKPVAVDIGTPGVLRDGFREVTKGVKPGQMVITVGMQKIRLGKNPLTQRPNLVKARPFDTEKDSTYPAPRKDSGTPLAAATTPATGAGRSPSSAAPPSTSLPAGASADASWGSRPASPTAPAGASRPSRSDSRSGRRGR
jgi:RND family efflux transporter MFP subunit